MGCWASCLSCDACNLRCVEMGSILVSVCRCAVLVSSVHPVIVLSALFCVVWSFVMFVSEAMGDHTVLAYSIMGRVIVLYVVVNVSLFLPQCVVVSVLSRFIVCVAFLFVFCMCVE